MLNRLIADESRAKDFLAYDSNLVQTMTIFVEEFEWSKQWKWAQINYSNQLLIAVLSLERNELCSRFISVRFAGFLIKMPNDVTYYWQFFSDHKLESICWDSLVIRWSVCDSIQIIVQLVAFYRSIACYHTFIDYSINLFTIKNGKQWIERQRSDSQPRPQWQNSGEKVQTDHHLDHMLLLFRLCKCSINLITRSLFKFNCLLWSSFRLSPRGFDQLYHRTGAQWYEDQTERLDR